MPLLHLPRLYLRVQSLFFPALQLQPNGPDRPCLFAGFFVTGLSGKILSHIFPPCFIERAIDNLHASIWRAVTQPPSRAFNPYFPKAISEPFVDNPFILPLCIFLNFTRDGINIVSYPWSLNFSSLSWSNQFINCFLVRHGIEFIFFHKTGFFLFKKFLICLSIKFLLEYPCFYAYFAFLDHRF